MSGEKLRDKALEQTRRHSPQDWWVSYQTIAQSKFLSYERETRFTGTELNSYIEKLIGHPHHHNAWGGAFSSFIKPLLKYGVVEFVGFEKSSVPKHHAHYVKVYKKL